MAKIPAKLRLNDRFEGDVDKVQNLIDDVYLDIAPNLNRKPDMIILPRNPNTPPGVIDDKSDLGTFWLNSETGSRFQLTARPSTWLAY